MFSPIEYVTGVYFAIRLEILPDPIGKFVSGMKGAVYERIPVLLILSEQEEQRFTILIRVSIFNSNFFMAIW